MQLQRRGRSLARKSWLVALSSAWIALLSAGPAAADDGDDSLAIAGLLDRFLAGVDRIEMHEQFWADDLVYTSSGGTRTTKDEILGAMRAADTGGDEPPPVTYAAEDVDIRVFGDAAIVAFRLVASPVGGSGARSEYFNTGTLLRRNGQWQVVAWQATRIPGAAGDAN